MYKDLPVSGSAQNVGVEVAGMSRNSMSPVKSSELVPPSVNVPPATSTLLDSDDRETYIAISGADS